MRNKEDVLKIDYLLKDDISKRENDDRGRKLRKIKLTVIEGVLMNENQNETKDIFLIYLVLKFIAL